MPSEETSIPPEALALLRKAIADIEATTEQAARFVAAKEHAMSANRPAELSASYQRLAQAVQKGMNMSSNDTWRWSQIDHSTTYDIHTIQIESVDLIGYLALSADGREWQYFVPDGDQLFLVATETEARARSAALPHDGLLHLPESMYVRHLRLSHRGGQLLGLFVPLDPNDRPAWSGVPTFTGTYPDAPAQLATEATMREILAELKQLSRGRLAS